MEGDKPRFTGVGIIAGIIAWFGFCIYQANQGACLRNSSCDADDLVMFGVIAVGMIAPAAIVALVVSLLHQGLSE